MREYATLPIVLLEPKGLLDVSELVVLKNTIARMMTHGKFHVVINLRRVRHLNYVGLTVLSEMAAKLRDFDGDIYFAGTGSYLALIFRSIGLDRHFLFFPTVREAVNAVKARSRRES